MSEVMTEKLPLRARIKHSYWSTVGDASLMGLYAGLMYADHKGDNVFDHSRFVLEIEQTSFGYRRDNGGPAEIIVPEFVPMCLLKDALSFQKQGIELIIEIVEIRHEPEL